MLGDLVSLGRWFLAALAGLAFAWIAALNWYALVRRAVARRGPSWIPFVGGALGALVITAQPLAAYHPFWWIALLADGGSVPGLLATLIFLSLRWRGRTAAK